MLNKNKNQTKPTSNKEFIFLLSKDNEIFPTFQFTLDFFHKYFECYYVNLLQGWLLL